MATSSYSYFANSESSGGGGAIALNFGNTFSLSNSTLESNSLIGGIGGGAIAAIQSNYIHLSKLSFLFNSATVSSSGGGAFWCGSFVNVLIEDCEFLYNSVEGSGSAGAVSLGSYGSVFVFNATFIGNFASDSCGALSVASQSTGELIALTFKDNSASISGGAVCLLETFEMKIRRSSWVGNTAGDSDEEGKGGGLFLNTDHFSVIENCDFIQNKALLGSAVFIATISRTLLTLNNNAFYANVATGGGTFFWLKSENSREPKNLTVLFHDDAETVESQLSQLLLSSTVLQLYYVCPAHEFKSQDKDWSYPFPPAVNCSFEAMGPLTAGGPEQCVSR